MRPHSILALLLACLAALASGCLVPGQQVFDDQVEEYKIYRLLIQEIAQPVDVMPVLDRTVPNHLRNLEADQHWSMIRTSAPTLKRETLQAFYDKNQERVAIEYQLDLPKGLVLINDDETARVPSYPGYVELSRVAFSADFSEALVYIGHLWTLEGSSGRGWYVTLRRQPGYGWSIDQRIVARVD